MTSHQTKRSRTSDTSDENTNITISSRNNEFSATTWWMVDIDGADNNINQGATPLVKRCMRVYNWNEERARKVLKAYRQFLFLKKHYEDWDATVLSPSLLVDQMWHQHILDVVNYCHDMTLLCGRVIGHNPDGAADVEEKIARDRRTSVCLDRHFEGEYEKEIWGIVERAGRVSPDESHAKTIITISVRDQSGEETFFKLHKSTKLRKVINAYAHRKGVDACELTFLLDGQHIWPDATPKMLELEDQDQIDVMLVQRGC